MDITEINTLFNDAKQLSKFTKKDLIRIDPNQPIVNTTTRINFDCRVLTNKLVQLSDGYLILRGNITRNDGADFAGGAAAIAVSIQNGTNTLFKSCKISLNNNEVEHNQRCDLTGTLINLFEYSKDYASSIAVQEGFARDTVNTPAANSPSVVIRNRSTGSELVAGTLGTYPVIAYIPLKNISQFIRRLNFPIINNHLSIDLEVNKVMSILRAAAITACTFTPTEIKLMVPEIQLPLATTTKLYKAIESGNFIKELRWDISTPIINNNVGANSNFDILIGTNLTGVRKIIFMLHDHFDDQQYSMFMSDIQVLDLNVEIDSKQLYNTNILNDHEVFRLVSECFNMQGKDTNTGSLISYNDFINNTRIHCLDLSRQEVFETDPNVNQTIRIRGRSVGAASRLICLLFQNRTTVIDFANPNNTKTTNTI